MTAKERSRKHYLENIEYYRKKNAKWNQLNPERRKELVHNCMLRRKYGITSDQFDTLSKNQKHRCAICRKKETSIINGTRIRLATDHDKKTGKIRGLLCSNCNQGLGRFQDSTKSLLEAIRYLWVSQQ